MSEGLEAHCGLILPSMIIQRLHDQFDIEIVRDDFDQGYGSDAMKEQVAK